MNSGTTVQSLTQLFGKEPFRFHYKAEMQDRVFRKCVPCVNIQLRKPSGVSCQFCHPVFNLELPLHLITVGN